MIDYFTNVEEPTLIFLGDNFPQVEESFYELLYGKSLDEVTGEERQQMFVTPFLIWANYDIEEKEIEAISSNYLALEILEAANISYDGFYTVLDEVYGEYPVVSKYGIINKEGQLLTYEDVKEDEMILLEQQLQYYQIYEK